ncbi:MAG: UDP-N-acetylmuramate--L-alanine ligase [Ezakiella sp.]|nr:UDP-N-acetylmuramate--L-alanine ligase [Ezakiella sp.]
MNIDLDNIKELHFIGIGGIGMSSMAFVLLERGYKITGSDQKITPICERLIEKGAIINAPQNKNNINNPDLIVYTDAIGENNEEYIAAKESNIPMVDRATFLGLLMKKYQNSIAITGTHGKTTTTSMLATIYKHSALKPTILIGGNLDEIGGNALVGEHDIFIAESCEYKGNILKYFPTTAVVLNIDEDHLDYYKSIYHIEETFMKFVSNLKEDSTLIINNDENNLMQIKESAPGKVITFSIYRESDFRATDIKYDSEGYVSYNLLFQDKLYPVSLNVMGLHNVLNSLAAIATAYSTGLTIEEIIKNIGYYHPVHQRLELLGKKNGVTVMDDYAHHPTEIMASLNAVKNMPNKRIYCVFQPHTYTRTKILLNGFADAFRLADKVVVIDIYAAREKDNHEVHSRDLVEAMVDRGVDCHYFPGFDEALVFLKEELRPDDLFITMGAGDVNKLAHMYLED